MDSYVHMDAAIVQLDFLVLTHGPTLRLFRYKCKNEVGCRDDKQTPFFNYYYQMS